MAFIRRMQTAHSIIACSSRTVLFNKVHSSIRGSRTFVDNVSKQPQIKSISDLPGPVSLPVIASSWTFFVGARNEPLGKRMLLSQEKLVNKYGRIFRMQLPGITIVSIMDPVDVAKVLRAETKYPQRLQFPILRYYREKRQKIPGVFFADGPEWYKYRSVLSKRMLRPKEVADYASGFNEIITDFIHRLRTVREPSGSEKENEVRELDSELFKWSFESVAEMLFDKRFGCLEPEVNKEAQTFIKAVGDFLYNAIAVNFLPTWFYKIYETQQVKTFFSSLDTMYEYADLFIGRKINELEEQQTVQSRHEVQSRHSSEALSRHSPEVQSRHSPEAQSRHSPEVQSRHSSEAQSRHSSEAQSRHLSEATEGDKAGFFDFLLSSGKLTKDDLLASVIDVLFAGVDTTSNTMQWMLYMMAKNPDKQNILRHEVLSVLGDTTLATPTTLAQMPYLKAWVRETLRLYPVLSVIPRRPTEDLILSGYLIPGGTATIHFLTYYMGRDENVFEDAEAFKPERWLRRKDVTLTEAAEAFSSIPFGFGTRMCLGRRIAELELHLYWPESCSSLRFPIPLMRRTLSR
ncbi:hypothetical protein OS493_002781 [Desmophyllum pertusum]|uniref:Cholesterol side-chain cleavage enzyme, mitochondrial n=1 Tax=Desmophyllum pertusum TaxID=174260 RepID=A0A9X0CIL6_9CNID|nr:hypothetical protein OS493_002781 [Desmophyllum pertusum]